MTSQSPASSGAPAADTGRRAPRASVPDIATPPLDLRLDLHWRSDGVQHCDSLVLPRAQLAQAVLPEPLAQAVTDTPAGAVTTHRFAPGELLADWDPQGLVTVQPSTFDGRDLGGGPIQPRRGRFYPGSLLVTARDQPGGGAPLRVVDVDTHSLRIDFNHPLAGKPLEVCTGSISAPTTGPVIAGEDSPKDLRALLTANGPGMQGRWRDQPTDFFADEPFLRADDDDPGFYARPRLVDHLDSAAIAEIRALYGRLIPRRSRILDLMASWHSHLPAALAPAQVAGVGMNAEELARNPALTQRMLHDLNTEPRLPCADATFDAVVCTVSVEYLTNPFAVFRELGRVLRPGGIAVMTFSNRWFPTKAIRLWQELHAFERPGLVLEYFRATDCFRALNTWSLRGLPRPADDRYARRLTLSDPLHAVWARRSG